MDTFFHNWKREVFYKVKSLVNEIIYKAFFVAPRVGLEPTTARLTAACSTD